MTIATPTSDVLREATARAHEDAEHSAFVVELMGGQREASAYAAMLGQLMFVYRALEQVGDRLGNDPIAAAVLDDRLRRVPSIEADLAHLGVDASTLSMLPATAAYVAAIEDSAADPARFVAHHYTRYLGDLSGGQIIAHKMRDHYGIADEALSFYRFAGIDKLKRYKDAYRDRLDALTLDAETSRRLTDEAIGAFEFNQRLFAELD